MTALIAGDKGIKHKASFSGEAHATEDDGKTTISETLKRVIMPAPPYEIDCLIEPHRVVEVATEVSGVLRSVNVDRGDMVEEGQVIAELESGVERVDVDLSRTRAKFNKSKYQRMKKVHKKKAISSQAKDEAETEKILSELELKRSIEALNMRTINSPFSGVVVERFVSPGELAERRKIAKIAQINPLNVEIIAPVSVLGTIHVGMQAMVYPEGPVKGPLQATVKIVDQVVDAASGTFGIRLELPNPDYKISAGVKCRAQFGL